MSNGTPTKNHFDVSALLVPSHCISPNTFACLFILTCCLAGPSVGQEDNAAEQYARGIIGRYTDDRGMTVARVEERIGNWPDKLPFGLKKGRPFTATWRGYLLARPEGQFQFHAYFAGSLRLTVDGRLVIDHRQNHAGRYRSDPVELKYGWRKLEVIFEAPATSPQLAIAWSGPGFAKEPLAWEHLYHDEPSKFDDRLDVGVQLIRDLQCAACHEIRQHDWLPPAPALTHVANNLKPTWIADWLSSDKRSAHDSMPSFGVSHEEAVAIAKHLEQTSIEIQNSSATGAGDADSGQELFLSVGCLACHQWNALGPSRTRGTVDLTGVADKRTRLFFETYLREPATINADHRMPVFDLASEERQDLVAFLNLQHPGTASEPTSRQKASTVDGKMLMTKLRCTACHRTNQANSEAPAKIALTIDSNWEDSCLNQPDPERARPGYNLKPNEQAAIRHVLSLSAANDFAIDNRRGSAVLRAKRCVSCHPRGSSRGLEQTALSVAEEHRQLTAVVPALIPPSLNRTGHKLRPDALRETIRRDGPRRRPWLKVRMPRFRFEDGELQSLVDYFVNADRFPTPSARTDEPKTATLVHAGTRLVTAGGFGCTSCHAIGGTAPPDAPLNALAPELAGLGQRIHRSWFDAWVRNPSRIVPRIEMPSITVPVPGVLEENLDHQLEAVWHVLNQPGFRPPEPNPIRVARRSRDHTAAERALVLTDVLRSGKRRFIKPFLVALPNRHSIVFDFQSGQLVQWSIGDAALQRTHGKSWFWEAAGTALLTSEEDRSDMAIVQHDRLQHADPVGQFVISIEGWQHIPNGVQVNGSLAFDTENDAKRLKFTECYLASDSPLQSGWLRRLDIQAAEAEDELRLRVIPANALPEVTWSKDRREARLSSGSLVRIDSPLDARFNVQGYVTGIRPDSAGRLQLTLKYSTSIPVDRFPQMPAASNDLAPRPIEVVPGFKAIRLPITDQLMPTSIDWRPNGRMLISSLKGRVWSVRDDDGDGIEESARVFSDELAAPFGVSARKNYVDVINKFGLLRMFDEDHDDFAERVVVLAAGWGHTDDYHDWAVGLPRSSDGRYFVALSCQQDQRSEAAAHLRGRVLQLTPQTKDMHQPLSYAVEEVSAGHRFPIGIALSRDEQLFVTDNQGNYNPYNELNHVRSNFHFGFVNELESGRSAPPLTAPAINIPHPWTRSVNGICFLDTPKTIAGPKFGPFEGHLIGCEYDTRRLIRLSLQPVGDTLQGAAYPFSLDHGEQPHADGFLGPLTAAVSPNGDVYVGDIRDSGWGGGPNHGAIVRLTPQLETLPPGIAEIRAVHNGFDIHFTQPVDRSRAADPANYVVAAARRVATPAYGGPDQDRSTELIVRLDVSRDNRRVRLVLARLKAGFVYEFHLKNLTEAPRFHPSVAFYTMNAVPADENSKSE